MTNNNFKHKQLAKNTLLLYVRMFLSMIITLYTSRVVLDYLGFSDYGIYNLVAGLVVMFGFLNNAMTASTQRFMAYEHASGNLNNIKKVFNVSLTVHLLLGVFIVLIAESIGVWFLNTKLNIPNDRMDAANWIFQLSIISFVINVFVVPYNAVIISHERMSVYAIIGMIEVILKLLVVYLLEIIAYDKLVVYSILMFFVTLIVKISDFFYCRYKFDECKELKFKWDKSLIQEMGSFAGWNLIGVFAGIGYVQIVNVILNLFYGTIINAARGIAFQINGAVSGLISNFQIALAPVITKNYAKKEYNETLNLVFRSSKFSYFLLLFLSCPLILKTKEIINIWLVNAPDYTIIFTKLIIIDLLITSLSGPLHLFIQSTGEVKKYQIIISTILLSNVPLSYIFLFFGYPPEVTFIISIFLSCLVFYIRLVLVKQKINFSIIDFFKNVILKIFTVTTILFFILYNLNIAFENTYIELLVFMVLSTLTVLFLIFIFGLDIKERKLILNLVFQKKWNL